MSLLKLIKSRKSIRKYKNSPIEDKDLEEILEAGRMAPSARNLQEYKIIVVKDSEVKKKIAEESKNQTFIAQAPVILVAVSLSPQKVMSCDVPTYAVDLAILMDHICLMAFEKGIGSCWIGAFNQDKIKKILDIPIEYKVGIIMPLGYPEDSSSKKVRKELSEIISYDKFS